MGHSEDNMEVYCYIENCKYRSKRKSKYVNGRGEPMYKCTRKSIIIDDSNTTEVDYEVAECKSALIKDNN